MTWYIVALAAVAWPVGIVLAAALAWFLRAAFAWCGWKRREILARAEWTQTNPYWREAFDAGANWADAGHPASRPFLARLKPLRPEKVT